MGFLYGIVAGLGFFVGFGLGYLVTILCGGSNLLLTSGLTTFACSSCRTSPCYLFPVKKCAFIESGVQLAGSLFVDPCATTAWI